MTHQKIFKKLSASTLVVVLVMIGITAIVLIYMLSKVAVQQQQQTLEKFTDRAELQAVSALDKLTRAYINKEVDFDTNQPDFIPMDEAPLNVCEADASSLEDKCADGSKVYVRDYKQIIRYSLKNDETIEVTMAEGTNKTNSANSLITVFADPNAGTPADVLLIMGYKYNASGVLNVAGECVVNYTGSISCLGDLQNVSAGILNTSSNSNVDKDYGSRYFKIKSNSGITFYRIKALLGNASSEIQVSATGDYTGSGKPADLPVKQVYVFTAIVYSPGAKERQTYTELTRMVWVHPQMPEVFDWVLFNGSNQPIAK